MEDYRTFRANQLANEEESWIIGISQSLIGGSGYFYRDTNKPQFAFVISNKQADSLHSLIADGRYRATSLGREKWKELIGSQGSLQYNCNKEGFNVVCSWSQNSKARIGIVSNNEDECDSCNSRIGFGTAGRPDNSNTCGNEADKFPDNGDKHIKAMGYILVQ